MTALVEGVSPKSFSQDAGVSTQLRQHCSRLKMKLMNSMKLKLNVDKTEFIIIGNKYIRVTYTNTSCYSSITTAEEVKDLGVTFDSKHF